MELVVPIHRPGDMGQAKELHVAKGQKKGNREAKKPKGAKKPGTGSVNPKNQMSATFTTLKASK